MEKSSKKCVKCGERFEFSQKDTWWDYSGYSDVKLVKCPCGCIQAINYGKPHDVNNDERYYDYKR